MWARSVAYASLQREALQRAAEEQQAQHRVEIAAKDAQLAEASAQQAELTARAEAAELEAEALQAEAATLAPAVEALAAARQAGRISDVECVGGVLLLSLQARHPKSWLWGTRTAQNAHRLAFGAAEAPAGPEV